MSNKTIAKFCLFVISPAIFAAIFSACSGISSKGDKIEPEIHYDPPKIIGNIKSGDITESSGIAASRCQNDVIWTHNDSDEGAYIFAFKPTGESLGTWKVQNADNIDWEDIAAYKDKSGKCFLYIGDIGDNELQFIEHSIYRIAEPVVKESDARSDRKNSMTTEPAEIVKYRYPDTKQNAETLVVQPMTGSIYVLTKRLVGPSGVYRIKPDFGKPETQKAQIIAEISLPAIPNGLLTGGDVSPDGKRVILCDYSQGYEFTLPEGAVNFDEIWLQKPEVVDLGERNQGESICYSVDGSSIFVTSEGQRSPVIVVKRR
ncbi:MAG: hypothetical protein IPL32_07870 [Chloracidobacterium sp.]|nr:hypothetical protein [Chloracidobacterium sp.]